MCKFSTRSPAPKNATPNVPREQITAVGRTVFAAVVRYGVLLGIVGLAAALIGSSPRCWLIGLMLAIALLQMLYVQRQMSLHRDPSQRQLHRRLHTAYIVLDLCKISFGFTALLWRMIKKGFAALGISLAMLGISSLPSGAQTACAGRIVKHAMGETCVPRQVKRLVVLDTGELDASIALGVKPVGAVTAPNQPFQNYLGDATKGIEVVGTIQQPSLEKILSLKPDLILSSKLRHAAIYPQLSKIAPTVFAEAVGVVWKDNLRLNARALGIESRADLLLARYENRARALRDKLRDAGRARLPTVSVVRFVPTQIRLMGKANYIGTILSDVGLPRPKAQDIDEFMRVITPESIPLMDADYLFYSHFGDVSKTDQTLVLENPLWARLEAVKNKRATKVDDDIWFLAIGILGANKVLDDLEKFVLAGVR